MENSDTKIAVLLFERLLSTPQRMAQFIIQEHIFAFDIHCSELGIATRAELLKICDAWNAATRRDPFLKSIEAPLEGWSFKIEGDKEWDLHIRAIFEKSQKGRRR